MLRPDKTSIGSREDSALEYNTKTANGLRKKANHNKFESQFFFFLVIGSTLLAPLFITLGTGSFFGKIVPAVLSVCAAAATAWLQLRKPQKLWTLYRQAQRRLEDHQVKYRYKVEPYDKDPDPDKRLVAETAAIALDVHYKWEGFVPDPDALGAVSAAANRQFGKAHSEDTGKGPNELKHRKR